MNLSVFPVRRLATVKILSGWTRRPDFMVVFEPSNGTYVHFFLRHSI